MPTISTNRFSKYFIFFLISFILSSYAVAQRQNSESPKIGKVKGKVVDATNGQPLQFSTITLLSQRDSSLVTGSIADENGVFLVEDIPVGAYKVRVAFMGYRNAVKDNLSINSKNPEQDLGEIKLNPVQKTLDEVVVSGEKEVFQNSIDKRVFNVEKSIVSEGGSATDVLETIPSISVDMDGNISLRGSGGVMVLIDGKPSGLTGSDRSAILEQIPASAIESIEVITNPSSKYDAEGMSGIINVILKKNKLQGMNGTATLSAGTRDKYNASANLNYRTSKFNIFSNYSYRYNTNFFRGLTSRENNSGEITTFLDQNLDGLNNGINHLVRGGVDYYLNEKNTIGISGTYNDGKDKRDRIIEFREFDFTRSPNRLYFRNNYNSEDEYNLDIVLNYRRTFNKPKQELTASAAYSTSFEQDRNRFIQQDYNFDYTPAEEFDPELQNNITDETNGIFTSQIDYIQPVSSEGKIEAGYKSIIRKIDNDLLFQDYDYEAMNWIVNTNFSNRFIFDEQIHSLYGNYSNTIKNLGYQIGTRIEQTYTTSTQKTTEEAFENNYLNFFPSAFFSYKLKKEQQIQLNYSRRINRPSMWNLNPFVNYSDPLNIRFGNPQLNPEFTNAFELSYVKGWKSLFLTSSVYYRKTNDIIQRVVSVNENNVSTTTFDNFNNRQSYGLEFIARATLNKWWNITGNYNFFRTMIDGSNVQTNFNNDNVTWSANLMSNMSIPKIMDVQLFANYRGPIATAQGLMKEMYWLNLGFKRNILENKATISLNISDLFDTRQFRMEIDGENFNQNFSRKRESQIVTLSFTYRFGGLKDQERRRGNRDGGNGEQGGGGDDDFF